jgi:nucleoside-diphosphate-sugar epimerase
MIVGKRILITGGAGFIGTHVAERLAERNQVTLLDIDLGNVLPYSPLTADDHVRKIHGDVRDPEVMEEEVANCQIVLHFASILGVREVIERARDTIDTIVLGTRNALEAARKRSTIERMVYISTSEVYGNITDAREGMPASVGTDNDGRLCYASAKLMGEHLVWAYHRDFGLPTVIIRPFNIYGPRRKAGHAVGLFIIKALAGKDVTLHGDGSQLRSWCYIDDFSNGIIACLEKDAAIGEDFNLGNARTAATIYDLAERTIRLVGSSSRIVTTPHTFTDIGVRAPNSLKAWTRLGYAPQYGMDAGLRPTIEWYRKHFDDFRDWL